MGLFEILKGEQPGLIKSLLHYEDIGQYGEYLTEYALLSRSMEGYYNVKTRAVRRDFMRCAQPAVRRGQDTRPTFLPVNGLFLQDDMFHFMDPSCLLSALLMHHICLLLQL